MPWFPFLGMVCLAALLWSVSFVMAGNDEPRRSILQLLPPRDVWTFDLSRNSALRLTAEEGHDESDTTWSPDGTRVVYSSAGRALIAVAAPGGGPPERLVESPLYVYPTSWWPGRYLVYADGRTYREQREGAGVQWGDLYLLDQESRPRPLATSPFAEAEGQLSPDSKYLLYVSTETGDCEVYVKGLDDTTGKWRISTGGGYKPRWRPDGGEIFYLTGRFSGVSGV